MAYLGQDEEQPTATTDYEEQAMSAAFQQFSNGDMLGAVSTLGPAGLQAAGLIPANVVPVLGAAIAVGLMLAKYFIGRGRTEADIITPVQNQLINPSGSGQLDQITQVFVRSHPTVQGLQSLYEQVIRIASAFVDFVSDPRFTDGRASAQALNTIMPYVNGTCGFTWPPPMGASQTNCLSWGDGTPGGVGTDGMLGALRRAILRQGGPEPPPYITQGMGPYPRLAPAGSQTFPYIPQAGTLPANAPLSPLRPSQVPVVGAGFDLPTMALIGGAAFLLLRPKRR